MKSLLALLLVLAFHSACTSNVGDGAMSEVDAATDASPQPDALPPGARDGEACQVTPDDASGGCAPGYACTVIDPGQAQCRQLCPTLQLPCAGYTGPGYSFCALSYNDGAGQLGNLCLVVCGDDNQTLRGCDEGACNGTCPGDSTCQNDANNFGLKSCQ